MSQEFEGKITSSLGERTDFSRVGTRLVSDFLQAGGGEKVLPRVEHFLSRLVYLDQVTGFVFEELAIYYRSKKAPNDELVIGGLDLIRLAREVLVDIPGCRQWGYEPYIMVDSRGFALPDGISVDCQDGSPMITRFLEAKLEYSNFSGSRRKKMHITCQRFRDFLARDGQPFVDRIAAHFGLRNGLATCSQRSLEKECLSVGNGADLANVRNPGIFVTRVPVTKEALFALTRTIFEPYGCFLRDRSLAIQNPT